MFQRLRHRPSLPRMSRTSFVASCLTLALSSACTQHQPSAHPEPRVEKSCPEAHTHHHGEVHGHGDGHEHGHEQGEAAAPHLATRAHGVVIPHGDLKAFGNNGNSLIGIATASLGAKNFEVWRSQVAPGGVTPPHVHESEEVFIVLRGRGQMIVGDQVLEFEAPATVIAPAGLVHQLKNTGDEPTDQIVIIGVGTRISNPEGETMELPWRH